MPDTTTGPWINTWTWIKILSPIQKYQTTQSKTTIRFVKIILEKDFMLLAKQSLAMIDLAQTKLIVKTSWIAKSQSDTLEDNSFFKSLIIS